jgi:hypothetical protein
MADAKAPSVESLRLELQEAITTFRHQNVQLIQALGVIVTADSVLLGYGFAQKLSSVLLVASLMPLAALSVYNTIMTALVPICYVAKELEKKLSLYDVPLIGTWVKTRDDLDRAVNAFDRLKQQKEPGRQKQRRPRPNVSRWFFLVNPTSWALLAAFAVQIGLVIISLFVYHFHFM